MRDNRRDVARRPHHDVVVDQAERGELALGVEHDLLHAPVGLLEDAADQPGLAGAARCRRERATVHELGDVDQDVRDDLVALELPKGRRDLDR